MCASADKILGILSRYFRLEVSGCEHVPRTGPGIIVANHSGWMGLDALLLSYVIRKKTGRDCHIMAHRGFFEWSRWIHRIACRNGLRKPSRLDACESLKNGDLLILFPEAEAGNFKSSAKRYQLQHFHRGFVSIAKETLAPVIPCGIVGAEDAQLNLGSVQVGPRLRSLRIPLPLLLPPLPSKWRMRFFEAIPSEKLTCFGNTPYSVAAGVAQSVRYELQENLLVLRNENKPGGSRTTIPLPPGPLSCTVSAMEIS